MKAFAVIVLLAGVAWTGCTEEVDPLIADLSDLCRATSATVDLSEQQSAFFDRAHDALHDLAGRVTEVNASVAERLLKAKQAVEAELVKGSDAVPGRAFSDLIATSNDALAELQAEEVSC